MKFSIDIEMPRGSFRIEKGGEILLEQENTITHKGIEVLSTSSYPNSVVDSNGGMFKYIRLGQGRESIDMSTKGISGDISQYNVASSECRVNYLTAESKRYADIHLKYEFPNAVAKYYIHQVGIFSNTTNTDMLFGQTLPEPLVIDEGENFTLYYSIRVQVISNWIQVGEGDFEGKGYTAYAQFHYESQDSLITRWPYNTGGSTLTSGWASRPVLNNNVLTDGVTRYNSSLEIVGNITTRRLNYTILPMSAGNLTFFLLELGNPSNSSNGFSIKLSFDSNITKSEEHMFILEFEIIIRWVST